MTKKKINAGIMLIFLILSVIVLFPILCLVIGALKPSSEIIRSGLNARIDLDIMGIFLILRACLHPEQSTLSGLKIVFC